MCSSKSHLLHPTANTDDAAATINGRPVLQPAASNRPLFERRILKTKSPAPTQTISPKTGAPIGNNALNSSSDKPKSVIPEKKSNKCTATPPGSIAAARREQVAVMQVQRKMKIAHYGRSKSAKFDSCSKLTSYSHLVNPTTATSEVRDQEKRCSFITPNSDPIYVAYHDEEWGVPVHDDNLLFELLVLTGAQVGSDWTSVLKRRQQYREAFSEFDAEIVSKFTEKKITTISVEFGIEVSLVRGVVDNSNCIIQIKKALGSFHKYIWGFVNHKPIATQYKLSHKMPAKTSKSEAISKDMVKRGFRQVGPTVIHSFMQAAGLTNDHLTTCPRHLPTIINYIN